jgi:tetratricopeptide (TPR) repeat protein
VIAAATIALAATLAADPCSLEAAPPTGGPTDPAAAALYEAVGDEARAAGDLATARVAYREALRIHPSPAAMERLREACREPVPPTGTAAPVSDRFADGVALMKKGDRRSAIAAFEIARAAHEDQPAALLEAVCEFELGHAYRARELFEIARGDPSLAPTASFFLGMLALEEGENERATALLGEAAAGDPRLAANASTLSVLARRGGRLVISALSEIAYDSNVELLVPNGTVMPVMPGSTGDGSALVAAGLTGRLSGASGPYARVGGQYRKQFVISAYDLGQAGGAVGGRYVHQGIDLAAEYGYDFVALGESPYLSANRALALARLWRGNTTFAASYSARLESFLPVAFEPYSGLRQNADVGVSRRFGRATSFGVGYRGELDDTFNEADLSYREHGPTVLLQLTPTAPARIVLEGRYSWRLYDAFDPNLGVTRVDRYLDGYLVAELDLGRWWTIRLTGTGRRAWSNVPDFRYTRLTATAGLVYTAGIL